MTRPQPVHKQMVVVLGQVLGQLEPGELVTGGDAPDQPGTLKVDEVPVGGASRYVGSSAAMSEMLTGWPCEASSSTMARRPEV